MPLPIDVAGGEAVRTTFGSATAVRDVAINGYSTTFGFLPPPAPKVEDLVPDDGVTTPVAAPILVKVRRDGLDSSKWAIELFVKYASSERVEVIYDGTQFCTGFSTGSSLSAVGTLITFSVLPDGGKWPDSPTIDYRAILLSGMNANVE